MAAATMSNVIAVLPVFLMGALSVPMRRDFGFSEVGLGVAVSLFFGVSALASVGGGWYSQRFGARAAITCGTLGSVACLLGIGVLTSRFEHVLALLCMGGCANAVSQPGANLMLAQVVPAGRRGVSFGLNQASVPIATLIAGLAVPLLALQVGWRWAFAVPTALAALLVIVWPRDVVPPTGPLEQVRVDGGGRRPYAPLALLAAAAAFGSAAANSLGAFSVASAVARGFSEGSGGLWLVTGSLCGAAGRLLWGWVADRRGGDHLRGVVLLMVAGAAAMLGLGHATGPVPLTLATVVGFSAGWGWTGLFNHAVVQRNERTPAMAIGVVTSGVFLGGATGPLLFGVVARHLGYTTAWSAAGAGLMTSSLLVVIARKRSPARDPIDTAPELRS